MSPDLDQVKRCANEFAWQWAWFVREHRENKSLAIARVWLEISQVLYRVNIRRVKQYGI